MLLPTNPRIPRYTSALYIKGHKLEDLSRGIIFESVLMRWEVGTKYLFEKEHVRDGTKARWKQNKIGVSL